ncbi:MAG: hypothetical protein LJF15_12765, partial [Acidobacteria bacterium]|nr:hypothetical protein [Acidobacteriota bacterium]
MSGSGGVSARPVALPILSATRLRRGISRVLIASLTIPGPLAVAPVAAGPAALPPPAAPETCSEALNAGGLPVVSVAHDEFWPPNHALVNVGLSIDA